MAGTENCREIHLGHHQQVAPHALLHSHKEYDLASDKTS